MTYGVRVWYMATAESMVPKAAPIIATAVPGWRVRGVGDVDHDGFVDLVLQNETSNAVSVWYMYGPTGAQTRSAPIIGVASPNWSIRTTR